MGTAATATKISGVSCIGPELYEAIYTVAFDTTTAAGLQTLDLTADFAYITNITTGGNDTAADNAYSIKSIHAIGTAITSTNVTLETRNISDGATVDSTDLSAVGALQITVIGKKA